MSKIYETWKDRIDSGRFSKAQCQQWAQAVVPLSKEMRPGGKSTNLEPHEARALREMLWNRPVLLEPEHTAQGFAWIERYGVKKLGLPADAIDNFRHFSFRGDADVNYQGDMARGATPIWHIHTTTGNEYIYAIDAWQSGGTGWWRLVEHATK